MLQQSVQQAVNQGLQTIPPPSLQTTEEDDEFSDKFDITPTKGIQPKSMDVEFVRPPSLID